MPQRNPRGVPPEAVRRTLVRRYGVAIVAFAASALVTYLVHDIAGPSLFVAPFLTFVAVSAWFGGLGPGLLTAALSALVASYFAATPVHMLAVSAADAVRLILFLVSALLVSWLAELQLAAARTVSDREREFRDVFELAGAGIGQADPATGRFLRVNRRFCEITGYTADELLTRTFRDITYPDDRARDETLVTPVLRGEVAEWTNEKRYVRKDGSIGHHSRSDRHAQPRLCGKRGRRPGVDVHGDAPRPARRGCRRRPASQPRRAGDACVHGKRAKARWRTRACRGR